MNGWRIRSSKSGEAGALRVLGKPGERNLAAAVSASCGSNGLPPGGAKIAQLPGCIWTRPMMPS